MNSDTVAPFHQATPVAALPTLGLTRSLRFVPSLPIAMVLMALLALGCGLAKGVLWGVPPPVAQDESGYLLNADTFASGRITNPTHPMWRHFESMFVIQQPTYTSKYPPGQGLVLALGQKVFGEPIVGVWLSTALASAAMCWMFWRWLTPSWALLASLIAVAHLVVNYWNFTYWGGSVAALGGALVFGGLRRFPAGFRAIDGLLVGLGIVIFANTRPFEGLVTCAAAALAFAAWMIRDHIRLPVAILLRMFVPLAAVLALAAFWIGFYNYRTTGSVLTFAQGVHSEAYYPVPVLVFQHPGPAPTFDHEYMRVQYLRDIQEFQKQRSIPGFVAAARTKFLAIWGFYVGIGLTLPLFALPLLLKNPWMRFALSVCAVSLAVMFFETWLFPHYAAPIAPLLFLILTECLIALSPWQWRGLPLGRGLVALVVLFHIALVGFAIFHRPQYIATREPWALARQQILQRLGHDGHNHLVIVRYAANHTPDAEWVYNKADLDKTPVVWAHEMSGEDERKILNYYSNRYVWLLEADTKPPRLSPLRAALPVSVN